MKKRRIIPTEHQEQAAVVDWFQSYARTKGIDPRLLIAIPNAQILLSTCGTDKFKVLAYLKAEGLQPSVPDLMLAWPKLESTINGYPNKMLPPIFNGLFVEMKRKGGKPSKDQLFMAGLLRSAGFNVVIAYGADEAMRAIKGYIES